MDLLTNMNGLEFVVLASIFLAGLIGFFKSFSTEEKCPNGGFKYAYSNKASKLFCTCGRTH